MPDIVLYIAASLDGYIATSDGSVDWLSSIEQAGEDYGYADFVNSVDGLVMGRNTYDQVMTFGDWPYGDLPCWVFSSRSLSPASSSVQQWQQSPAQWAAIAEVAAMNRIWLVGGAQLTAAFQDADLLDEYYISWVPCCLGTGIPLFLPCSSPRTLTLISVQSFPTGVVQTIHRRQTAQKLG
jgi:dihydrofolate reductase